MAVMLTAEEMRHTKASNPYIVKKPNQVTNKFTITKESDAADTLKLKEKQEIDKLKGFLKDYDMTSISTDDLKKVGGLLYENGLIDSRTFYMFVVGDGASDAKGFQTDTHVKFNAIALFNEKLEEEVERFNSDPQILKREGAADYLKGMVNANHAINALAYFVNSRRNALSVDERT